MLLKNYCCSLSYKFLCKGRQLQESEPIAVGLKRKGFFHFCKKRKSCEHFRFRESFAKIFVSVNFFCINFSFRKYCRENFCQKICKNFRFNVRFRENFRLNFGYFRIFSYDFFAKSENKFSRKYENENFRFNPT
jgi:hypothetical protein